MSYFKEVGKEMKRVTWPTVSEANHFTWISVMFIVVFAAYFGLADQVFSWLIKWFVHL